jgi:hypothetical protein
MIEPILRYTDVLGTTDTLFLIDLWAPFHEDRVEQAATVGTHLAQLVRRYADSCEQPRIEFDNAPRLLVGNAVELRPAFRVILTVVPVVLARDGFAFKRVVAA